MNRHGLDDHECLSIRDLVGHAEMNERRVPRRRHRRKSLGGPARQRHGWLSGAHIDDAHVAPGDTVAHSGSQRLGAGLLGGEAFGVARGPVILAFRTGALDIGLDPVREPISETIDRFLDPANVTQIRSDTQNHR